MTRQGNGACGWRLLACAAAAAATPHRKLTAFIVDPREAQLYDAVAHAPIEISYTDKTRHF